MAQDMAEPSSSLADLTAKLNAGPSGLADAKAVVEAAKASQSDLLDLQQLKLSDEDLSEILPLLPELGSHVISLNLFLNELTRFPAAVAKALPNLRVIHFGANPLQSFDDGALVGLTVLEELDVGFSECLGALPPSIGECKALRKLYAGNGRLRSLPLDLFACSSLEELHLYGNDLSELPAAVGNLKRLRVLNIGRNQISRLPDELASCTSLETLHAYENSLSSLPLYIDKLPALKVINVENNPQLPPLPQDIKRSADAHGIAKFYAREKRQGLVS